MTQSFIGILVVLNVAEQSQALADLYADYTLYELSVGWVKSYWMAYWLSWMLLSCQKLYVIYIQSDFFYLNCLLGD